jgi:hypothetical protein
VIVALVRLLAILLVLGIATTAEAQRRPAPRPRAAAPARTPVEQRITSPREEFGQPLGADYFLANYRQLTSYWQKLDRQSERMTLERIGTSSEGRPMWMAIITSPENQRRLASYQQSARRLALAEGLTDAQARTLARDGKAVVWIDGGLHASEVLGAQQLMELVYEMVSQNDPETLRFLNDVILLAVHANPDGHDFVADWYMRRSDPRSRSTDKLPRLYHKYVGHDNNRDSFLASQKETQAMDSIMFRAWFPQIMYNHHQTAPAGTIMFAPPFRDPFNYNIDPLIITMLDQVGGAMHSRMIAERKAGTVMREGADFSTWWNGGLRTTVYFHNMVGLLTETFGHPTPRHLEWVPERLLPSGSLPLPIVPQLWHFRQSMDYSRTANRAVLDFASRHREDLLFNVYRAARNSIERGSRDHWTPTPTRIERLQEMYTRDSLERAVARTNERRGNAGTPLGAAMEQNADSAAPGATTWAAAPNAAYLGVLRDPAARDPRGYIIPADQPDFLTATKFVNALMKTGVTIHRATAPFTVRGGRTYPAGSFVVRAAQAFRPHVRDMFEPQDHPDDFLYPGGPPIPPYDNAGWTLAFQMGVVFDRIRDAFDCPCARVAGIAAVPAGRIRDAENAGGYVLSHGTNDSFLAVNRLLAIGQPVYWLRDRVAATGSSPGAWFIPASTTVRPFLERLASENGLSFDTTAARAFSNAIQVAPVRIGLWDIHGGSMPSGWTRWLLEQFEFPHTLVFPPDLDAGNLRSKFDVLILPDGAHTIERDSRPDQTRAAATAPADAPAEWVARSGVMTEERTVPQLRRFLEEGGTILAIGSATELAYQLGVPITDALRDATGAKLPRTDFYIPGSVLRMRVDPAHPLAHGIPEHVDVFFDESPAFRVGEGARERGVRTVGWFDTDNVLRSGWAWRQQMLEGTAAVVEVPFGRGTLVLYGPEVLFRAQPHGTFKLLFNGIHYRGAAAWQ